MNASYSDMYRTLMAGKLKGDEELQVAKSVQKQLVQRLKELGHADDIPDDDDDTNPDDVIVNFVGAAPGSKPVVGSSSPEDQWAEETSQPEIPEPLRPHIRTHCVNMLVAVTRLLRRICRRNGGDK